MRLIRPDNRVSIDLLDNDEDLSYLELKSIPQNVYNPLLDYPIDKPPSDPIEDIVHLLSTRDYLHWACKVILNLELLPFQLVILDTLWRKRLPMLIASRGGGKSFIMSVYALLRMIFHPGCKIVIVGAAFRQSRQLHDYMTTIWEKAPVLRDIAGKGAGPKREVDRCEFWIGDSVTYAIPLGDGCVSPSTLITYEDKFGTIGSLFDDNHEKDNQLIEKHKVKIWGNGLFNISDEKYYNGIKNTKRITTANGFSFEATTNHPIKLLRNHQIQWIRSDEINVGDRILIDRSYRWHNGRQDISINDCYSLGLMIGDGCWTDKYRLRFTTKDFELIESLNSSDFGKSFVKTSEDVHWNMYGIDEVKKWMDKWDLDLCKTIDKKLSKIALSLSKQQMTACLQGLFDTDGGVQVLNDKRGGTSICVSFWNTSEELIDQIQYILLHYSIISKKRSRQRKNINWNREFQLIITGKDVSIFAKEINFRLKRKKELLNTALFNKSRLVSLHDIVPNIKDELIRISQNNKCSNSNDVCPSKISSRKEITRDYLELFLTKYKNCDDPFFEKLNELSNPNIYYDEVISIENGKCPTYDVHIPNGHEYCANGFFSHNTKIRGLRANYIACDEFASVPEDIFNLVVQGFGVVAASPVDKVKQAALIKKLKEIGSWTDEMEKLRVLNATGNQIIYSGTAFYAFNHFYRYFKKWHSIISSKGDMDKLKDLFGENEGSSEGFDWKDYAILRIPFNHLPDGYLDPGILAQARATLHHSQYLMEYGAIFAADSDGFFKRSIIEAATTNKPILVPSGKSVQFSTIRQGSKDRAYVISIDPAADADNAAIVVLEVHNDHRRVVSCWTTNRKKYNAFKKSMKQSGIDVQDDYYRYITKKIRSLMRSFNTERIVMDKNGGGVAIQEALASRDTCEGNEKPVFLLIDPEEPKATDVEEGVHILELVVPTSELNSEANHGMLKDLQDKTLLFPMFDTIEMEKSIQVDKLNNIQFDTYEDLVQEIEELKSEMTTIVLTGSSTLGKEVFDTPQIKMEGGKKGRLRKDRYSALLYANYYARNRNKNDVLKIEYKAVGGTRDTFKTTIKPNSTGSLYHGPGALKFLNSNWQKNTTNFRISNRKNR